MTSRRRRIITVLLGGTFLLAAAVDIALMARRARYRSETARLWKDMTQAERDNAERAMVIEEHRTKVMFELMRRQALVDPDLHLSVILDSSLMVLERGGAVLRRMVVEIGEEVLLDTLPGARHVAMPRGTRSFERLVWPGERLELPAWAWEYRGEVAPAVRDDPAFHDGGGFLMSSGTLVYAIPSAGPLADVEWILPGAIRVSAEDLRALEPNLTRGLRIYLF